MREKGKKNLLGLGGEDVGVKEFERGDLKQEGPQDGILLSPWSTAGALKCCLCHQGASQSVLREINSPISLILEGLLKCARTIS